METSSTRRVFIGVVASGSAAFLAGCSGTDDSGDDESGDNGDESDPGDPEDIFEEYVERTDDGDFEGINEELYADEAEGEDWIEEDVDYLQAVDFEKTDIDTLERDDDVAKVEVSFRIDYPEDGEERMHTDVFELRVVDGEWRLWDIVG